ncbi:MAG: hypothetical protein AVDCRST_MAG65-1268, partial [uncultured Solirubrobacteraceae bacterium]
RRASHHLREGRPPRIRRAGQRRRPRAHRTSAQAGARRPRREHRSPLL